MLENTRGISWGRTKIEFEGNANLNKYKSVRQNVRILGKKISRLTTLAV